MSVRHDVSVGDRTVGVIDLTLPVGPGSQVFPGDPEIEREVTSRADETGFEYYVHRVGDHVFVPHADAPKHQNLDMKDVGVEVWGPEHEFNEALLIDLESAGDASEVDGVRFVHTMTLDHLKPHEADLADVTAVIVRTGIEGRRLRGLPFTPNTIPGFTAEAGAFLASLDNLRVVGTDSLTVDIVNLDAPNHDVHQALKHKMIVESLVHLSDIPEANRRRFLLQTALVKVHGATGCPVVARAWLT